MKYYGRTQIFTDETEITRDNVVSVLQKSMLKHYKNRGEIEYLYKYYKGFQPILTRKKEVRPEICNKIVENWANEIVSFKVGYLCGSPIQYVSGNSKDDVSEKIDLLNKYMEARGKASKDKDLIEWQMIGGTSYMFGIPADDGDAPFDIYALDPRNTFVVYRNDYSKKPIMGVTYSNRWDNGVSIKEFTVYTEREIFIIKQDKIISVTPHILGAIPIIEYPANNARLGAFEIVLDLLDAINDIDSNRLDGVEQFIQSLMVVYNATLEDETGNSIREKGLIELKSVGENKADIKLITQELNQDQTQTLKKDIMQRVREIVGLPSQGDGSTGDSSNNGAMILKGGWENAETRAKESELMYRQSDRQFLKLILGICAGYTEENGGFVLDYKDVDVRFTRRNYENLQVKAQVLTTMLHENKIDPKLAFQASGLFIDPEEAYRTSMEYYEKVGRTEQSNNGVPTAQQPTEQAESDRQPA